MSEAGPAKRNNLPGLTPEEPDNSDLYRTITRHKSHLPDKSHAREEMTPEETAEEETEIIDIPEFERKISAMTSLDRDTALRLASDLVIRLHRRTCSERFR